ncbi:MAG: hypothetical protein JNM13_15585 [Hyphomicrobiaceae bacterium]|nr:hypothetical protein [Hyphomicrobiaceae bacterium]
MSSPLTIRALGDVVCGYYDVRWIDVVSARRTANVTHARQMLYWLARRQTTHGYPAIGAVLGGRDHTTILHGDRRIEQLAAIDPAIAAECADLEALTAACARVLTRRAADVDAETVAQRLVLAASGTDLERRRAAATSTEDLVLLASAYLNRLEAERQGLIASPLMAVIDAARAHIAAGMAASLAAPGSAAEARARQETATTRAELSAALSIAAHHYRVTKTTGEAAQAAE